MRAVKVFAVALLIPLAAYAIHSLCWRPYQCEVVKQAAQRDLFAIFNLPQTLRVVTKARSRIGELQRCLAVSPTDVDLYMTVAGLDRVLGRFDHASEMYSTALTYDRRPELYLNLGLLQLERNQRDEAFPNLIRAVLFNIDFINEIPNLDDRAAVLAAVQAQQGKAPIETVIGPHNRP
jgi:tetratricopeptide (TPR) repeat protein